MTLFSKRFITICTGITLLASVNLTATAVAAEKPLIIGLDADMSSASAESGEAIRRGMVVAIDEINEAGGVMGRPLKLKVSDHRGNPARGVDNINTLANMDSVLAVMGGLHTSVVMAELKTVHDEDLLFLVPWAAGTIIIDNGYTPNNVFRVSVRDQFAGHFLAETAQRRGFKSVGLLLENTAWGRSNERALRTATADLGMTVAGLQWFSWGVKDLSAHVEALNKNGSDVIILVANAREGAVAMHAIAKGAQDTRRPIISHWGITGGKFVSMLGNDFDKIDLTFLQTYSFLRPTVPNKAKAFLSRYYKLFPDTSGPHGITSPVGTAHAYDLVHMLARAATQAGSHETAAVRDAMENLGRYDGLVKTYNPPFTPSRHDALTQDDFTIARFLQSGAIVPADK